MPQRLTWRVYNSGSAQPGRAFAESFAELPDHLQQKMVELMVQAQDPTWFRSAGGKHLKGLRNGNGLYELRIGTRRGSAPRLVFAQQGDSLVAYLAFRKGSNSDNTRAIEYAAAKHKVVRQSGIDKSTLPMAIDVNSGVARLMFGDDALAVIAAQQAETVTESREPRIAPRSSVSLTERLFRGRRGGHENQADTPAARPRKQDAQERKAEKRAAKDALRAATRQEVAESAIKLNERQWARLGPDMLTLLTEWDQLQANISTLAGSEAFSSSQNGAERDIAEQPDHRSAPHGSIIRVSTSGKGIAIGNGARNGPPPVRTIRARSAEMERLLKNIHSNEPRPKNPSKTTGNNPRSKSGSKLKIQQNRKLQRLVENENRLGLRIGSRVLDSPPEAIANALGDHLTNEHIRRAGRPDKQLVAAAHAIRYHARYGIPLTGPVLGDPTGRKRHTDQRCEYDRCLELVQSAQDSMRVEPGLRLTSKTAGHEPPEGVAFG